MTQETGKVQAYPTFRPGPGVRGEGTKLETRTTPHSYALLLWSPRTLLCRE
jgi:hypothetical protein